MTKKIGVLLTNTGTPDAPTIIAVRRYLKEFLSDKRVIRLPRLLWLPILYGIILPLRPKRSAKLYQKIWTKEGAPMRSIMQKLAQQLQTKLTKVGHFSVAVGMNYGSPSIQAGLEKLRRDQVEELIILPLYPQYSHTTTASSFDRITKVLKNWKKEPCAQQIKEYSSDRQYIRSLAATVIKHWEEKGLGEHLLISFHGIPKRYAKAGDPYPKQCEKTAGLLAKELGLSQEKWTLCYQSRFGYNQWLQPSAQELFEQLPQQGFHNIDVICPGFPIDCLETLEEIAIRGQETFLEAGGKALRYIPALNADEVHIDCLTHLILAKLSDRTSSNY